MPPSPSGGIRMQIAISAAVESDVAERHVQRRLSCLVRHHEIEVKRRVFARGVNRGAGSAGQDGLDAVPFQSCPYRERDLLEGRLLGDCHRGFPVRRGRRRSVVTARWSSGSASASFARYAASSRLGEVGRIQREEPGSAHRPAGHEAIELETPKRSLDPGPVALQGHDSALAHSCSRAAGSQGGFEFGFVRRRDLIRHL